MAIKTLTTNSGKTIKVEMVREVQDKVAFADGDNIVVGREIVEYENIYFYDGKKLLASGKSISPMIGRNAESMRKQGAVAQIGNVAISQQVADMIQAAFAELDSENPKSQEYLAIKKSQADALARWEAEEPMRRQREDFMRKMEREDSDY